MPEDDAARQSWEMLLRQMLGEEGAREAMSALEASGFDPEQLARTTGLPTDPASLQAMMGQMQRMMSGSGVDGVNWSLAHDVARQVAHTGGDPSLTAAQASRATTALSVADLWLDAATDLPPAGGSRSAWSRAQWVEGTLEVWKRLTQPVASSIAEALVGAITSQHETMPIAGGGAQMLRSLGGTVFGMQVGQAAGTLAREVFGTSDTGLPLVDGHGTALVLTNVEEFAAGLDAAPEEVLHLLAVREAAHARLYAHVPWLRHHILGLVEEYARGIAIDVDAMEEAVRSIDVTDPEALRSALSGGEIFAVERTPEQAGALDRLETALALVEGWVEDVTGRAVAPHLAHAVPLREMLRRRRAAGGPAEHVFSSLVGLQLRPRKLREAAALWAALHDEGGPAAREALWEHPDILPRSEDLDDGAAFLARREAAKAADAEMDAALEQLLSGEPESGGDEHDGHREDGGDR
ncbi:putative hydrolase [Salana multivorans]|uniref:Putative hydrolase n=1 Tax=Salana multivorans TaxID=120377 RepID=A0A3N2DCL8_9MICO|nr:zinc-dependent metalloprotease [Salana multivorans]ROR97526.1 putative hydrolase [Salana multivorans]